MGKHRKWDDDHGPGWPTDDPDLEERTIRTTPIIIPEIPPIKDPLKED